MRQGGQGRRGDKGDKGDKETRRRGDKGENLIMLFLKTKLSDYYSKNIAIALNLTF